MTIVVIGDYERILRMHREGLILFVDCCPDSGYGNEGGRVPYFVIFSYILLDLSTQILSIPHTSRLTVIIIARSTSPTVRLCYSANFNKHCHHH